MTRQDGTALTEFVVIMVVMVPLMFGIPMIGKMIDLKQTTVQASRFSAWETTVQAGTAPAGSQSLDELFYSDASAPIGQDSERANALWGAEVSAGTVAVPQSGFIADTAVVVNPGAASSVLSAYETAESKGLEYGPAASHGPAYAIGDVIKIVGDASRSLGTGGSWNDMQTDGLVRGVASVNIEGNGWLDPMTLTQGTVIMNDNWSASGAEAARDRVRVLVPAGALKGVGEFLGIIGQVPGIRELKDFGVDDGRGVFGYVDMEPLPLSETEQLRPLKTYEGGE